MGDMTKDQIIEYMRNHHYVKVDHWLFDPEEYLYMKPDGKVYTEEGYLFEDFHTPYNHNGLRIRTGRYWEEGWNVRND